MGNGWDGVAESGGDGPDAIASRRIRCDRFGFPLRDPQVEFASEGLQRVLSPINVLTDQLDATGLGCLGATATRPSL